MKNWYIFIAAQKSNYGYLGCYLEEDLSSKLLSLGDVSRIFVRPPISPESCSKFCSSEKYMFFFLKNEYDYVYNIILNKRQFFFFFANKCIYSQTILKCELPFNELLILVFFSTCYCSKNYISKLMKQFDNECTIKCKGDELTLCGGAPNLVSAYITDSSSKSK